MPGMPPRASAMPLYAPPPPPPTSRGMRAHRPLPPLPELHEYAPAGQQRMYQAPQAPPSQPSGMSLSHICIGGFAIILVVLCALAIVVPEVLGLGSRPSAMDMPGGVRDPADAGALPGWAAAPAALPKTRNLTMAQAEAQSPGIVLQGSEAEILASVAALPGVADVIVVADGCGFARQQMGELVQGSPAPVSIKFIDRSRVTAALIKAWDVPLSAHGGIPTPTHVLLRNGLQIGAAAGLMSRDAGSRFRDHATWVGSQLAMEQATVAEVPSAVPPAPPAPAAAGQTLFAR